MWEAIRQMASEALDRGSMWLRHAALVNELFQLGEEQAAVRLRDAVRAMSAQEFAHFGEVLNTLYAQAQSAYQLAEQNRQNEWGNSFEDRMARMMAGIQSGEGVSREMQEAEARARGLQAIAAYAQRFRDEAQAGDMPPAGTPGAASTQQPAAAPSTRPAAVQATAPGTGQDAIHAIEALMASGNLPADTAGFLRQIAQLPPEEMQAVLSRLQELGADQGASPPLDIRAHYHPSDGRFRLLWPLGDLPPLPVEFDEMDRETQFHVLWGEWSRREVEAGMLLHQGDTGGARAAFVECLGRACQLEVRELMARSHEGLMRVAQKEGDLAEERRCLEAAQAARAA